MEDHWDPRPPVSVLGRLVLHALKLGFLCFVQGQEEGLPPPPQLPASITSIPDTAQAQVPEYSSKTYLEQIVGGAPSCR